MMGGDYIGPYLYLSMKAPISKEGDMKRRLFFATLILPLSGCEITLHFYVEKAWDVSPGFTAANPDMKTTT
jgi:hypothetical protein